MNRSGEAPAEERAEADNFVFTAPDAHVLIVDDNPINLSVASGIIEPLEMHVDTAGSAAETIEKVRSTKYDMIFMDHMMPEVDGVETTHILRRLVEGYEDVPIIALTANAMGGTKEMFLREGMNDFLAKPIEVSEMVAMVKKWLPKEMIVPVVKLPGERRKESGPLEIAGLDSGHAIAMLGSEKLYMQVLKDYYHEVDKRAEMIRQALENNDIKNYTIEVHSLKSTSRQIGASELSDLAARLEKAGIDNDVEFIRANTDELIAEYQGCKKLLAPLFEEASDTAEDYERISGLLSRAEKVLGSDEQALREALDELSECRLTPAQAQCGERLRALAGKKDYASFSLILGMWRDIAAAEAGKGVSSAEDVRSALDNMQCALDEFDSLLIDDALEQLRALALPEEQSGLLERLGQAAEDSDIDLCMEIVGEWQGLLGS